MRAALILSCVVFLLLCASVQLQKVGLDILPIYEANIFPNQPPKKFLHPGCFRNTTAWFENFNENGATLIFQSENPASFYCNDVFVMLEQKQWTYALIILRGKHTYDLKWKTPEEYEMVKKLGLFIFLVQKNLKELYEIYEMYQTWVKEDPATTKKFLEDQLHIKYPQRKQPYIMLDESQIQDGDTLAITKWNKEEAGIMFLSSSRTGHSAIFMRDPSTHILYVIEATPEYGGIHKTEYREWMRLHTNGERCKPENCAAVHLRLRKEIAAVVKNNTRRAWDFFSKMENLPYIYHANFFAGLDRPEVCFAPPFADCELIVAVMGILDKVYPDTFRNYFMEAFEHRLNKRFADFPDLINYLSSVNKTVQEIWSIPEDDHWTYEDDRVAVQCTSLAVRMLKESYAFDAAWKTPLGWSDNQINANEFHPRDMYEAKLWDTDPSTKPSQCFDGYADGKGYCQILGKNVIELPTFATVDTYPHMNEHCMPNIHQPLGC